MKVLALSAALAAVLAVPAFAQSSQLPATTVTGNQNQLLSTMEAAGATKAVTVNGEVFKADTSDGAPAFVVVVPQNFIGTLSGNENNLQSTLSKAGMKNIDAVSNSTLVKGILDDKDSDKEGFLAVSGVDFSNSNSTSDLNESQFKNKLKSAGINEESTFKGKLASAQNANGKKIYMIVGDQELTPDGGKFNFDDSKVRSAFDKANLSNLKMLDDTQVVQAKMNNETMFVVTGNDLTGK